MSSVFGQKNRSNCHVIELKYTGKADHPVFSMDFYIWDDMDDHL